MSTDIYDSNGNYAGRREDDGTLRDRDGNYNGRLESDGTLRDKDGCYNGRLEEDGTLRDKDGCYNGRRESDGTLRDKDGSYNGRESNDGGGCFITTACVEERGLDDDCLELETLRAFRDNWLAVTSEGREQIARYYRIAPVIVDRINHREDRKAVYSDLYTRLVEKSVLLINSNDMSGAYKLYKGIVDELAEKYDVM